MSDDMPVKVNNNNQDPAWGKLNLLSTESS